VKIATSSTSFQRHLDAGELTQLEWLDWCARTLPIDGVVADVAHFPRTDGDYLAQVKKLAVDLGVTVAAVRDDRLLSGEPGSAPTATFAVAGAIGAPVAIVRAAPASDDPEAWNSLVASAKEAAGRAKAANVTLALRAAEGTLCPDAAGIKRLAKDVDSSWLRFALDPASQQSEPSEGILPKAVIATHQSVELDAFGADVHAALSAALRDLKAFRGFFSLDYVGEGDTRNLVRIQLAWLRTLLAKEELE
jgi:hypothetical protein